MSENRRDGQGLWLFFALAFGWTWLFWVPLALAEQGMVSLPDGLYRFLNESNPAAWGPSLAALFVTLLKGGWPALKKLLRRGVQARFGLFWYAICLLLFPIVLGLAQLAAQLAGEQVPPSPAFANLISLPFAFVSIFLLSGPLQEEFGWRGFATERLQSKWNALTASIVVGIVWAAWHLPLFLVPRSEAYYNRPLWGIFVTNVLLSVLLTWVYNNTRRSVFAVMLLHTSFNWSNYLFTSLYTDVGGLVFFALMIVLVVIVVSVWGPRTLADRRAQSVSGGPLMKQPSVGEGT